jgi:hypothetical protein
MTFRLLIMSFIEHKFPKECDYDFEFRLVIFNGSFFNTFCCMHVTCGNGISIPSLSKQLLVFTKFSSYLLFTW